MDTQEILTLISPRFISVETDISNHSTYDLTGDRISLIIILKIIEIENRLY